MLTREEEKALECLMGYHAYVKMIKSSLGFTEDWKKLVDVLKNPAENRPIKDLKPEADRTKVWDFAKKEFIERKLTRTRGSLKEGATHGPKTSVTLAPPDGRMNYFNIEYGIGILLDGRLLDFKKRSDGEAGKLIFGSNQGTNNKFWIFGQSKAAIPEGMTQAQLVEQVKGNYEKGIITNWNEAMACLCKEALLAIITPQNTLTDRLNALSRQQFIKYHLNISLPILIMTPTHSVRVYTLQDQMVDIFEVLKREETNAGYQFYTQHIYSSSFDFPSDFKVNVTVDKNNLKKIESEPSLLVLALNANPQLMKDFKCPTSFDRLNRNIVWWAMYFGFQAIADWAPASMSFNFKKTMKKIPEVYKAFREKKITFDDYEQLNKNGYRALNNSIIQQLFIDNIFTVDLLNQIHYSSEQLICLISLDKIQQAFRQPNKSKLLSRLQALSGDETLVIVNNSLALSCFLMGLKRSYLLKLNFNQLQELAIGPEIIINIEFLQALSEGKLSYESLFALKPEARNLLVNKNILKYLVEGSLQIKMLNQLNENGIKLFMLFPDHYFFGYSIAKGHLQADDLNQFEISKIPDDKVTCRVVAIFWQLSYQKYGLGKFTQILSDFNYGWIPEALLSLFLKINWDSIISADPDFAIELVSQIPKHVNHRLDSAGNTLLHFACAAGQNRVVEHLLSIDGIEVEIVRTSDQKTPWELASAFPDIQLLFKHKSIRQFEIFKKMIAEKDSHKDILDQILVIFNESFFDRMSEILNFVRQKSFLLYGSICRDLIPLFLEYMIEKNVEMTFMVDVVTLEKESNDSEVRSAIQYYRQWVYPLIASKVELNNTQCRYKHLLFCLLKLELTDLVKNYQLKIQTSWLLPLQTQKSSSLTLVDQLTILIDKSKTLKGLNTRLYYFLVMTQEVSFFNLPFQDFRSEIYQIALRIQKVQPQDMQKKISFFPQQVTKQEDSEKTALMATQYANHSL